MFGKRKVQPSDESHVQAVDLAWLAKIIQHLICIGMPADFVVGFLEAIAADGNYENPPGFIGFHVEQWRGRVLIWCHEERQSERYWQVCPHKAYDEIGKAVSAFYRGPNRFDEQRLVRPVDCHAAERASRSHQFGRTENTI